MRWHIVSRRTFLRSSSAALAAGGVAAMHLNHAAGDSKTNGNAKVHFKQAVACVRREAAAAAKSVLLEGGNAIDAAVAALLVLCVIDPPKVGLGGYGGTLVSYRAKTGRVH